MCGDRLINLILSYEVYKNLQSSENWNLVDPKVELNSTINDKSSKVFNDFSPA